MTDKSSTVPRASLAEDEVLDYLREHPGFTERYLGRLLGDAELRHDSGAAVSLIERQVKLLRAENRKVEKKLLNLVHVARANERLGARMQKLAVVILESDSLGDLLSNVESTFREEFDAERVVLRLLPHASVGAAGLPARYVLGAGAELPRALKDTLRKRRAYCGHLRETQLRVVFGEAGRDVASAALVPLFGGREFGLLALGSKSAERFQPALGVLFLEQIGELLSAALKRWLT